MAILTHLYFKYYRRKVKKRSKKGHGMLKYVLAEMIVLGITGYWMFGGDDDYRPRKRGDLADMLAQSSANVNGLSPDHFSNKKVESDCPTRVPKYTTNFTVPSNAKFLLPILKWGPNNQIVGFYEAMHLAKKLGRLLVLPPFFFHESDRLHSRRKLHPPSELRVNSEGIPNMVTMDEWYKYCGRKTDAAFITTDIFHQGLTSRVLLFSHDMEIKLLDDQGRHFIPDVRVFPNIEEIKGDDGAEKVQANWENYYADGADQKCVVFVLPFRTILHPSTEMTLPNQAYDYSSLINTLAHGFLRQFTGITLGVHWRYNRGDWSHRCYRANKPPECSIMKNLDLEKVSPALSQIREGNIYIAAPLSELDTIEKVAQSAPSGVKVYDSSQLMKWITDNYSDCSFFKDYEGEVVSLTEQALLTAIPEFLLWPTSSWSARIHDLRKQQGKSSQRESLLDVLGTCGKD